MKLGILFIFYLFLFTNILFSQTDIKEIFNIKHDKFEKQTDLTLKTPILIKNKKMVLSLTLNRNFYSTEDHPGGCRCTSIYFNITPFVSKNDQKPIVKIFFKNGKIDVPYAFTDNSGNTCFYFDMNVNELGNGESEVTDFCFYTKFLIETIRIQMNGKQFDFDLTEEKSQLLRNYIELLGNYTYY